MQKTASKNVIPSGSYDFLIWLTIQLPTIRMQTSNRDSRYLKITLETVFEKTIQVRRLKLGSYVPLMRLNKLK